MTGCCDPRGADDIFGDRFARSRARRYRRKGLDATSRRIVDFVVHRGVEGASVLEIGGGVGEIQLELLRRGASHATNLELVDAYDALARDMASEAGLGRRVERRIVDIAEDPEEVEAADVVVLNRVVCCYPDYDRLLRAAAEHARRLLVLSFPSRNVGTRAVLGGQNLMFRVSGKSFRTFAHPPEAMFAVLERGGLRATYRHRSPVWQVAGLERAVTRRA